MQDPKHLSSRATTVTQFLIIYCHRYEFEVTITRKKGTWILSSVYIQWLWRQTLYPFQNARNMCLPLEAPHIKKLLSPVLHDILCPYVSHPPVTSFFIYRVQQNKQKYTEYSGQTKDTGASSNMPYISFIQTKGVAYKENLSSLSFYMYRIERQVWYL